MRETCYQAVAGAVAALTLTCVPAAPALADDAPLPQTWVIAEGADTGNCTSLYPCVTIAYAEGRTAAGGILNIADSGNYGAVSITKSLTLRGDGTRPLIIGAFTIAAGPTDVIALEGLDMEGTSPDTTYVTGLTIAQAGEVLVKNCEFKDYRGANSSGQAINIASVSTVRVTLRDVTLFNNAGGVRVGTTGGVGRLKMLGATLMANTSFGVRVIGSGNNATVYASQIVGSAKALDLQNGGLVTSYGNNVINGGDAPSNLVILN